MSSDPHCYGRDGCRRRAKGNIHSDPSAGPSHDMNGPKPRRGTSMATDRRASRMSNAAPLPAEGPPARSTNRVDLETVVDAAKATYAPRETSPSPAATGALLASRAPTPGGASLTPGTPSAVDDLPSRRRCRELHRQRVASRSVGQNGARPKRRCQSPRASECFQVLAHKNRDGFDRRFSIGSPSLPASDRRATIAVRGQTWAQTGA